MDEASSIEDKKLIIETFSLMAVEEDATKDYTIDISKSNYFLSLPMVIKPLKSRIYRKDFKEKDDKLASGWRFKIREQKNPQYTGGIRKHKIFLTPDNRTVHTGLGVIEFLRLEGKLDQEELWNLAQHLGIEKKKFQKLWASQ